MTITEMIAFKDALKQTCKTLIEARIQAAIQLMNAAQEAANSEGKSSAGDKYETARAMGHLEKDLHARQLAENRKELASLSAIDTHFIAVAIGPGTYFETSKAAFFIAAGLGKQCIDGAWIFFLSPQAPLAKMLENNKIGDTFQFQGVQTSITNIF
jgi:hypothetical protein